jgi:hypothetical protein
MFHHHLAGYERLEMPVEFWAGQHDRELKDEIDKGTVRIRDTTNCLKGLPYTVFLDWA